MWDVVYMGYSDIMMEYLLASDDFNLCKVVGVRGRISERQYHLILENNLEYKELNDPKEIRGIETFIGDIQTVIIYKFEYIIPLHLINDFKIFNFHGGNLRSNRGAHATVRSILNMDKETCLSLYQLTGGIDEGILINEHFVQITDSDTVITLNEKLVQGIPQQLKYLKKYLDGQIEGELITQGKYYPKIKEEDYSINIEEDSMQLICAKIRSQASYAGAIFNNGNAKYRIKSYKYRECETGGNFRGIKDGKLLIKEDGKILECIMDTKEI